MWSREQHSTQIQRITDQDENKILVIWTVLMEHVLTRKDRYKSDEASTHLNHLMCKKIRYKEQE